MPPITLEEVQARQTELAKMIEQLASQAQQSREAHGKGLSLIHI